MSVPRQGRKQTMNPKVSSTREYPRNDKNSPSPSGSQMSNTKAHFNSTKPQERLRDNRFDRIAQVNQVIQQTQSLGPMSHSSLIGSAQSNSLNQGHPLINGETYKQILNPQGVAMFNQKQLRKETQRELSQMQNRIKLL